MSNPITWQALRALADKVQGRQDRDQYVRIDETGIHHALDATVDRGLRVSKVEREKKKDLIKVLVPNATFKDAPQCIDAHTHDSSDVACAGDALFWSMASVEKFVLPYYAGFWGLEQLAQEIREVFAREDVLAILHRPDSEPTRGDATASADWPRRSLALLVRASGTTLKFTAFPPGH